MSVKFRTILLSAATLAVGAAGATAQVIKPSQTTTVSPRSFDMSSGPIAEPAEPFLAPRPRVPDAARLNQLKRKPAPAPTPAQPIPQKSDGAAPARNCTTNSAAGYAPSDVIGAVGFSNLVVATNAQVNVYAKSNCALQSATTLNSLFGAAAGENYFDPQVLWDEKHTRFIVTAESSFGTGTDQNQGFAISKDGSGSSWWVYKQPIISGANKFCVGATDDFWDYPHVGSINGPAQQWVIAANVFPAAGGFHANVISIDKTPTLSGGATTLQCYQNLRGNLAPPNVLDNHWVGMFLSPGSGSGTDIRRYALHTGLNQMVETTPVTIPAWTAPPNAQTPNGVYLDTMDGRFVGQTIQHGTNLWNVHAIDGGGRSVGRLYHLSTAATAPLAYGDLMTGLGDSIFNVSVATNTTRAWVSATRTIQSDPVNGAAAMLVFTGPNYTNAGWSFDLAASSAAQFDASNNCTAVDPCRWGDYSSVQIDPFNRSNAWAFNQLVTGTSQFNWSTNAAFETGSQVWMFNGLGDFNGDGKSDIVWRGGDGTTAIWTMNGGSILAGLGVPPLPNQWQVAGIGDFDGDGRSDILWRYTDGTYVIWFMNADGSIKSTASLPKVDGGWRVAGIGDFNGDGKADILLRSGSNGMAIWEMNGGSILAGVGVQALGGDWAMQGLADFNGDGRSDILWRNADGTVVIWFMNADGSIASAANIGQIDSTWSIAGVGKFSADSKGDIVWRRNDGSMAIWKMNGGAILSGASVQPLGPDWALQGVGDFNGDGLSDLIWRNNNGTIAVWLMNGGTILAGGGGQQLP